MRAASQSPSPVAIASHAVRHPSPGQPLHRSPGACVCVLPRPRQRQRQPRHHRPRYRGKRAPRVPFTRSPRPLWLPDIAQRGSASTHTTSAVRTYRPRYRKTQAVGGVRSACLLTQCSRSCASSPQRNSPSAKPDASTVSTRGPAPSSLGPHGRAEPALVRHPGQPPGQAQKRRAQRSGRSGREAPWSCNVRAAGRYARMHERDDSLAA